jgi:hypothetical protein
MNINRTSSRRRIVIFSTEDIIPNIILNHTLGEIQSLGLRAQVFLTPILVRRQPHPPALARMAFYETTLPREVLYPALERGTAGWGFACNRELRTFNELARAYGDWDRIATLDDPLVGAALDHPEFLGAISAHNYLLFKDRHLNRIRQRGGFVWNLHHGPLPDNRGILAPFWNLLEGRSAHGVSLHEVTDGIDTGALVATARLRLSARRSVLASMIELAVPGAHLLVQTLRRLVHGHPVLPLPQPARSGLYRSFPDQDAIARAEHRGIHLVGHPESMVDLYSDLYQLDADFVAGELWPAIARFEAAWQRGSEPEPEGAQSTPTWLPPAQASNALTRFT